LAEQKQQNSELMSKVGELKQSHIKLESQVSGNTAMAVRLKEELSVMQDGAKHKA